jgi:hypothetical protein
MLKNPFAIDAVGRILHVDEADRATAPFECPGCHAAMRLVSTSVPYARKGGSKTIVNRGHFSHQGSCSGGGGNGSTNGLTGLETGLHLWAKMLIEERMGITLPPHKVWYIGTSRSFVTEWTYQAVTLEPWQDGIRPDVVLHHDQGTLNVEIRVSHWVEENKADLLRRRVQSCIEIDLSDCDFDSTPADELRDRILNSAPRHWIAHQLDAERTKIVKIEHVLRIEAMAADIRRGLENMPKSISEERSTRDEVEIEELGTGPFIGRAVAGSYWFGVPDRNWQHAVLRRWLLSPSGRNAEISLGTWNGRMELGDLYNESLPPYHHMNHEVMMAAGITAHQYGSPDATIRAYVQMLCDEPDIPDAHPVHARMITLQAESNTWRIDPRTSAYVYRKSCLKASFMAAGRRKGLGSADFRTWYATPLGKGRRTPETMCMDDDVHHARLISYLDAIVNMLDGGRPADYLLGIEDAWFRDRRAHEYHADGAKGGPRPYHGDTHCRCRSVDMMRSGQPAHAILKSMAYRLHRDRASAEKFLQSPNPSLGNSTPIDFAIDVATMQRCIKLMPADPRTRTPRGTTFKRIW